MCLVLALSAVLPATLASASLQHAMRPPARLSPPEAGPPESMPQADYCLDCLWFAQGHLDDLHDIIEEAGPNITCGKIRDALNETGSHIEADICYIMCEIVGLAEFIKLEKKADLDGVYFCEILDMCPYFDGGDAQFQYLNVTPQSGPQGERVIELKYVTENGTGTGELFINITTVDGVPVEHKYLQERKPRNNVYEYIELRLISDPNCNNKTQECEKWLPGTYTVTAQICNGECNSPHPHSHVYDTISTTFNITSKSTDRHH